MPVTNFAGILLNRLKHLQALPSGTPQPACYFESEVETVRWQQQFSRNRLPEPNLGGQSKSGPQACNASST